MASQVTLYQRLSGWRMDSCWFLTDAIKYCLTAVSCKSLMPMLQTLAGTAVWLPTVQEIAADISTSMFWVQKPTKSIYVALICLIILYLISSVISLVCVPTLFLPVSPTIAGLGPDSSAEEVTVTLSSPTSLVCEVQSYPPALITWLKDGTPFVSSRNIRVLPGLTSHVHDSGTELNKLEYNSKVHLFIFHHICFRRRENSADPQC